jgi:hypothetical protein
LIELRLNPGTRELNRFGGLLAGFIAVAGGLRYVRHGLVPAATIPLAIAVILAVVFYAFRPLRLPIFRGWVRLTYPIGWVVSHAILVLLYFGILTPIALLKRAVGRDTIRHRPGSSSWKMHIGPADTSSYFNEY